MSMCGRVVLETLGSQLIMPKNVPKHWIKLLCLLINGDTSKLI